MLTNSGTKILMGLALLVLLGVTLQVSLAESSAFEERTGHAIKRSMEDDASHDLRFKRQADEDESSEHHRKHKHKHHGSKSTTPAPDASGGSSSKPISHKHHSSTTTKAPGKDGEIKTKESSNTTTKSPKGSGTSTKKSEHHSTDKSSLNPTTHLLLQQQEKTALDHMLAGVYDWIKVLRMTKGATLNKMAAGELLTQMEEVKKKLKKSEKPDKLVRLYKEFNEE